MSIFRRAERQILKAIDKAAEKRTMEAIGSLSTIMIKERTARGRTFDKIGGKNVKFKPLDKDTVTRRKSLKKQGKLTGPKATPKKSSVTRSGDMINSTDWKARKGETTIQPKERKERKKAQDNADLGRKYIGLTKQEINKLTKVVKSILIRAIESIRVV